MTATQEKPLYSVHPGLAQVETTIARLKEKTGRTLEEWVEFVQQSGPSTEPERRDWLKAEHGLGTNYAWWIAEQVEGKGQEDRDPDAYLQAAANWVEAMFAGGKAEMRSVYDALLQLGLSLGDDVKACPCKTIVPLYRRHVFAQIKPAARNRIDFGLALDNTAPTERLLSTGGFEKGDRITHRFAITSLDDIDDEVKRWLRAAYERDDR
jgi:hypothetical protein